MMKKFHSSKYKLIYMLSKSLLTSLGLLCLVVTNLTGQADFTSKQEIYQNQQRASNLVIFRSNIKLVDDAPERCQLRLQIIWFIFEKKVTNYYDTANSMALECLDETVDNREQFSASKADWQKSEILSLLRKNSPALAVKVEKKYFVDGNGTDLTDSMDAQLGHDPNGLANRQVAKIAREGVTPSVGSLVYSLRQGNNNAAALRILGAALDYYETHLEAAYEGNDLTVLESEYSDSRTPVELHRRFYNLMVRIGEAAIANPGNEEPSSIYLDIMSYTMIDLKQVIPELYPRASAIYNALNSKKNEQEKDRDEIYKRIEESKDKLAQTLSEAESAKDNDLKDSLWLRASMYAMEVKKFRIAAESRLKMRAQIEILKRVQYGFIKDEVVDGCLKENDIESAQYVIGLVEDPEMKAEGLFKIAAKLIELKKREAAFDALSEGWKVLEKTENKTSKLWVMHLAIPIALKIDKTRAFDMAGDIVKTVNRFPTPGPDDKPGTGARQKYADNLTGLSMNLETIFGQLAKENASLADTVSQGLQLKELRFAAQIAIETQRVYPLPPELEKTSK
jgi:hypothetical protein